MVESVDGYDVSLPHDGAVGDYYCGAIPLTDSLYFNILEIKFSNITCKCWFVLITNMTYLAIYL